MISSQDRCGWLLVDKPEGITSNRVNGHVRKILGCKGTGFAGTLDPFASGLLPIAIGKATKTIPYLMHRNKTYEFTIQWGENRDSGDREGTVTATSDSIPSDAKIQEALQSFQGPILQTPPVYSALKIQGVRACDRVRRGEHVTLKPRHVHIHAWHLLNHDPKHGTSRFRVTCGSGTYVRSLAVDLAQNMGVCGHVALLRRTSVGPFDVECAFPLVSLQKLSHSDVGKVMLPLEVVLDDIPDISVTEAQALMLQQGQPCCVDLCAFLEGAKVWAHLPHTRHIIALGEVRDQKVWPVRVFNTLIEKD